MLRLLSVFPVHFVIGLSLLLSACGPVVPEPTRPLTPQEHAYTPRPPETMPPARMPKEAPAREQDDSVAYAAPEHVVKIGLLLPMSGPHADLGQGMADAAFLALNDKYGTLSRSEALRVRVVLVPKDTRGTPEGAVKAMRHAIRDGVDLVIGPVFSSSVQAIAPLARAKKLNVLSFSNNKHIAGGGVFILGFQPEAQVRRIVTYAMNTGLKKFAALAPNDAYGQLVVGELTQVTGGNPEQLDRIEFYPPQVERPVKEVKRLVEFDPEPPQEEAKKESELYEEWSRYEGLETGPEEKQLSFEALLIPEGGDRLLTLVELLAAEGFTPEDVQLLGTVWWEQLANEDLQTVAGGWFAGSSPKRQQVFERRFYKTYGYVPKDLASIAYDAMALTATLAYGEAGPDFSRKTLTDPVGFNGPVDGIFRFREDGVVERGLAVIEVTPRGFKVIDPEPVSFAAE